MLKTVHLKHICIFKNIMSIKYYKKKKGTIDELNSSPCY